MITESFIPLPIRLRRNRKTEAIRSLTRETTLQASDFVYPLFLIEGQKQREPIESMPGIERLSQDQLIETAMHLHAQGIQAIALFPCVKQILKTGDGREAWNPEGMIPKALRALKEAIPSLCLIADVALDPYTTHGHDGVLDDSGTVHNDATLECLCKMSIVLAHAGADYIAPSDMMDGRVQAIRQTLDAEKCSQTGILSYSIKYASSLYTPFRSAVRSHLAIGNKKTYQMDPGNRREALLEAALDEKEGADVLMIKPATLYLDVIAHLRERTNRPIAAYHVSGEYAMVMSAHEKGYLDAEKVFYETLLSIKRAGADIIFSYATPLILPLL